MPFQIGNLVAHDRPVDGRLFPVGEVFLLLGDGCVAVHWFDETTVREVFRPGELQKVRRISSARRSRSPSPANRR